MIFRKLANFPLAISVLIYLLAIGSTQAVPQPPTRVLKNGFFNKKLPTVKTTQPNLELTQDLATQKNLLASKEQTYEILNFLVDYTLAKRDNKELPHEYGEDLKLLGRLYSCYKFLQSKIGPILRNSNSFENLDHLEAFQFFVKSANLITFAGTKEIQSDIKKEQTALYMKDENDLNCAKPHIIEGKVLDLKALGKSIVYLSLTNDKTLRFGRIFACSLKIDPQEWLLPKTSQLYHNFISKLNTSELETASELITLCSHEKSNTCSIILLNSSNTSPEIPLSIDVYVNSFNPVTSHDTLAPESFHSVVRFPEGVELNRRFKNKCQFLSGGDTTYLIIAITYSLQNNEESFLFFEIAREFKLLPSKVKFHSNEDTKKAYHKEHGCISIFRFASKRFNRGLLGTRARSSSGCYNI
jgi:hypothetical protein